VLVLFCSKIQTVYNEIKATESSAQLADTFTEGIRLDIFILLQTRYWVGEIQKYNEPLGRSACIRAPVVHLFMVIFTLSGWDASDNNISTSTSYRIVRIVAAETLLKAKYNIMLADHVRSHNQSTVFMM